MINNAIKFTERGSVELAVACVERTPTKAVMHFTVTDTGIGIAPEHIPRLTERFYRVDRSRSRESGGTGLGLAIVKHIAMVHGGSVIAESVIGHGSRFSLIIPLANK